MKTRKGAAVAVLFVAAMTVVLYFVTRSERGEPAAHMPPREVPPRTAPVAPPALPAALPTSASASAAVEVARSVDISAARAAVARPANKETRARAAPERHAEPGVETPNPEDAPASDPVASANLLASADAGASADPVASADAGARAEPSALEPVSQAELAPAPPKLPLPLPEARAVGTFEDRVGASFTLTRVTCVLDGQTVFSGAGGQSLQLFQRTLSPGAHSVSVIAEYRGHGAGVFSYARGYEFKVSSARRFNAGPGKRVQISVIGHEKGGPTVDFAERLALTISAP